MLYTEHFSLLQTPQNEPLEGQVKNSAGGYAFPVDDWILLNRFLILGTEGGTYYAGEKALTLGNARAVVRCLKENGPRAVKLALEISDAGRAPKNDPALFVLALAFAVGNAETKNQARQAFPGIVRTGTHLFTFLENIKSLRGWGRTLRSAVGHWYLDQSPDKVAYQAIKYRHRKGWAHRDALRLAHPKPRSEDQQALFRWITREVLSDAVPKLVHDFMRLSESTHYSQACAALEENHSLSWEMVPTECLGHVNVWKVLLPSLPMTAMIRNLGRMTALGLLVPMNDATTLVCERLKDREILRASRIHPIAILAALLTYKSGHGDKGSLRWEPVTSIIDALDNAFYLSMGYLTPSDKRILLALDVSGSMSVGAVGGVQELTPRVASSALALVTARTEAHYHIMAFSKEMVPLSISPRQRLDDVIAETHRLPFGRTDCALPMIWAFENNLQVDAFVIYTDSETWCGKIHPVQALGEYRRRMNIPAKLVVVGMVSNNFSIADPNDTGMLDVVGFDLATPALIMDFCR